MHTIPMTAGIYKIVNTVNNRIYIGSSMNLCSRKNRHFNELRKNKHINHYLQNDFNKCGEKNFVFEIIEEYDLITLNELLILEQYYINNFYDKQLNCYNINPFSNHPGGRPLSKLAYEKMLLFTRSGEFRTKMSRIHKGKIVLKETRDKMSISKLGQNNSFFGKTHKESTKKKLSELGKTRMKGKKFPKHKLITKPIISFNLITNETIFFNSIIEATKHFDLKQSSITDVLLGRKKTAKKKTLRFEYQKKSSLDVPK